MKFCKVMTASEKKKARPVNKGKGMIHSFETFGALDGPGLRMVVFFEGCPLRCVYCHNRDMLDLKDYISMSPGELMGKVKEYKPYFGRRGGVTISGGDPMYQPKFLLAFLKLCRKERIHVTLDTSLFVSEKVLAGIVPYVDLFMVSLKHFDSKKHERLTGVGNELILENARYLCEKIGKVRGSGGKKRKGFCLRQKLWFRYLILPGYTDTRRNLKAFVKFLHEVKCFDLVDLLPYHTYGVYKWKELGLNYALKGVKAPSSGSVQKIKKMLEKEGFKVLLNE